MSYVHIIDFILNLNLSNSMMKNQTSSYFSSKRSLQGTDKFFINSLFIVIINRNLTCWFNIQTIKGDHKYDSIKNKTI